MTSFELDVAAIAAAVVNGPPGHRLLLFDFDGTLREFTGVPADADLPDHRRQLLTALERRRDATVGIVSGRRISDVRARAGVDGLIYSGLHGLEIDTGAVSFRHEQAAATRTLVPALVEALTTAVGSLPGVLVEDKRLSVVVHWRMAGPRERLELQRRIADIIAGPLGQGRVRLQTGNDVLEVLPNISWNKGDAVRWICEHVARDREDDIWPLFVGDDATDENAFRAIGDAGVTVVVGERESHAQFRLPNPLAVEALLRRLVSLPRLQGKSYAAARIQ